jgi:hydrogenase expression/formation protein HypE
MSPLPVGKVDPNFLEKLISRHTRQSKRVIIGAGIGEDAAIIDMGHHYLVAKTDPITHVTGDLGHYAVNINANDIAAMGGKPLWFLATILMPEGSLPEELERIFSQLSESCDTLGITYCGGHTEITTSVRNPVVIGQMLGEVDPENLKPSSGGSEGDDLLMTKCAAIEATAIMALERREILVKRLGENLVRRAAAYLRDPGLSVLKEAEIVTPFREVHALHDPTEGGIATGVFEIATASGLGAEMDVDLIPITDETRRLCDFFDIDPLGTFASGSLLIAVAPSATRKVIDRLEAEGIRAVRIGSLVSVDRGMVLLKGGKAGPLPVYHQDELSRIFG